MSEVSRLRWQCRRGMRELDDLLLRYLDGQYLRASDEEKDAFQAILALSDPELNGYLLNRQIPAAEMQARVIQQILEPTEH